MSRFIKNVASSYTGINPKSAELSPKSNNLKIENTEKHVLVVWPNAQKNLKSIRQVVKQYFKNFEEFEINIDSKLYLKLICKIYDVEMVKAEERAKVSGYGPFTVVVISEKGPLYENLWRFGTGYTNTNVKISNCKSELRNLLGHPYLIHSSNDQIEAKMNLRLLLGRSLKKHFQNQREVLNNNDEIFSFLNDVDDYLILRDYSPGDIDVLTRKTPKQYANLLDAQHERLRFLTFPLEQSVSPIDVVNIHHGIFCPIWSENMLRNKVYDAVANRYRPNKEDLLFSLMYHYVCHKREIPEIGKKLLNDKILDLGYIKMLGIDYNNKKDCIYYLVKFLRKHHYSVPQPKDPKMFFDFEVANYLRKELNYTDLSFDPQIKVDPKISENFQSIIKNIELLQTLKEISENSPTLVYSQKRNSICEQAFLDTAILNVEFCVGNITKTYVLKMFYSKYKIVLDEIEKSLSIATGIESKVLVTPVKYERFGSFLFCLEDYVRGDSIDKYLYKNKKNVSKEDVYLWFHNIKTALDKNKISHFDIHANNILILENKQAVLIDFKTSRSKKTGFINPISCFKSSSNDDDIAIEQLCDYLESILVGGKIRGSYNPRISKLIEHKFNEKFPDFKSTIKAGRQYMKNPEKSLIDTLKNLENFNTQLKTENDLSQYEKFLFTITDKFSEELERVKLE